MKKFLYIMAVGKRPELLVGNCADLAKASAIFKQMPQLSSDTKTKLVYAEECKDEVTSTERVKAVYAMDRAQKEALIVGVNPSWVELLPGVNTDLK